MNDTHSLNNKKERKKFEKVKICNYGGHPLYIYEHIFSIINVSIDRTEKGILVQFRFKKCRFGFEGLSKIE